MGWGIAKVMRETTLQGCHAPRKQYKGVGKTKHGKKPIVAVAASKKKVSPPQLEYPAGQHTAIVDAAAAFRRLAFKGCSALHAANSVLTLANTSQPNRVSIMFDLKKSAAYPPQRAELHQKRYAGKVLSQEDAVNLCAMLACTRADLPVYTISKPLLLRTDLDWALMFMDKDFKVFAFSVFAVALKHAATAMFASGNLLPDASVSILMPDGSCSMVTIKSISKQLEMPFYSAFGEGDLRCFGLTLVSLLRKKNPVVVYSIDTDFLLMTLASSAWVKEIEPLSLPPLRIVLSDTVYDGNLVMRNFGSACTADRINTAFWAMGFGTDYSNPLTNNGFFNRDVRNLLYAGGHGKQPITILNDTQAQFNLADAVALLEPYKNNHKKIPKDSLRETLLKMLFCLQYYGFMFVSADMLLFPQTCTIEAGFTLTFQYKPNINVLGC